MIDRIIFGDNQFFGINHMSEEKAQGLAERFGTLESITDVIDTAYKCGIRAFMLNTNERAAGICDYLRANLKQYPDMVFYPSMPYAHKYANAVAEKGIFGAIRELILKDSTAGDVIGMLAKGSMSLFEKDMLKVMQLLVDMEMKMFRGLPLRVVFLQNIVTDLLLGFQVSEAFTGFASYVRDKYGVEAGFVTTNMPMLVRFLTKSGLENPIVCSSINRAGYSMNPNREAYETALRENNFRPIAMSVLASGGISPREAIEYVCREQRIPSVVFGASTRQHIQETKALIDSCFQGRP